MLADFVKRTASSCLAQAVRPDGALIQTTATARAVRMYREAQWHGWIPPSPFPPVPTMALLLDPRRGPPADAVISRDALTAAAAALPEAENRWHDLPIGGVLTRPWIRPGYTRAARALPPRGRRSRPARAPSSTAPRAEASPATSQVCPRSLAARPGPPWP